MVNQLRKERFPVEIRINWNRIWKDPLIIPANLSGIKVKRGRINSTTWLPNVSNLCHHSGAQGSISQSIFNGAIQKARPFQLTKTRKKHIVKQFSFLVGFMKFTPGEHSKQRGLDSVVFHKSSSYLKKYMGLHNSK